MRNKGYIICIDGNDCTGKKTQTVNLYNRLKESNYKVALFSFPNYKSESSSLVKKYLNGDFGKDPEKINPYMVSSLFALDRISTYLKEIKPLYEDGYIIILDRYTTSNAIHQAAKFNNQEEKDEFLDWCFNYEYNELELPKPDKVFFLKMPYEISQKLNENRVNKIDNSQTKDIHESNNEYMRKSNETAMYVAEKENWDIISCLNENNELRCIDSINDEIYLDMLSEIKHNIK